MSDYLRFTKDGLLEFEWDPESRSYPSSKVEAKDIFAKLRMACKIDPDVTLRDIFETVEQYPALLKFMAQYSWCWAIREFHEQARLPAKITKDDDVEYLEISRFVECRTWEGQKYTPDISDNLNFLGVGKPTEEHGGCYSVSLSPMNEIAHLPVRLNEKCTLLKDHNTEGEYETTFSLLEVLDAIYDDISFHGGPKEAAEFSRELLLMVDDVESGRAELVPLEDVLGNKTVN